jgi:hypothetical protein
MLIISLYKHLSNIFRLFCSNIEIKLYNCNNDESPKITRLQNIK